MTGFIKKYFGWRDWAVLVYNSIFENVFILFYVLLREQTMGTEQLIQTLVFLLFSMFSTTYGYLINDYADMELDRAHGKANTFSADGKGKALAVTLLFLFLSVISGWYFSDHQDFLLIWFIWIFIGSFYSLPPLRFKERGKPGLLLVVLAQRLLPILLVFTAFGFERTAEIVLLAAYVFFRGLSSDVNHQVEDYENDVKTETGTFAVSTGLGLAQKVLRFSLEMEKILLAVILAMFLYVFAWFDVLPLMLLVAAVLLYYGLWFYSIFLSFKSPGLDVNPFKGRGDVFQLLHHSYPSVILSLVFSLIVSYFNLEFLIIFLLMALIRRLFSVELIKSTFIYRTLSKVVHRE